jgi:hypothetical protein
MIVYLAILLIGGLISALPVSIAGEWIPPWMPWPIIYLLQIPKLVIVGIPTLFLAGLALHTIDPSDSARSRWRMPNILLSTKASYARALVAGLLWLPMSIIYALALKDALPNLFDPSIRAEFTRLIMFLVLFIVVPMSCYLPLICLTRLQVIMARRKAIII